MAAACCSLRFIVSPRFTLSIWKGSPLVSQQESVKKRQVCFIVGFWTSCVMGGFVFIGADTPTADYSWAPRTPRPFG